MLSKILKIAYKLYLTKSDRIHLNILIYCEKIAEQEQSDSANIIGRRFPVFPYLIHNGRNFQTSEILLSNQIVVNRMT